jgi:hypothetical protein
MIKPCRFRHEKSWGTFCACPIVHLNSTNNVIVPEIHCARRGGIHCPWTEVPDEPLLVPHEKPPPRQYRHVKKEAPDGKKVHATLYRKYSMFGRMLRAIFGLLNLEAGHSCSCKAIAGQLDALPLEYIEQEMGMVVERLQTEMMKLSLSEMAAAAKKIAFDKVLGKQPDFDFNNVPKSIAMVALRWAKNPNTIEEKVMNAMQMGATRPATPPTPAVPQVVLKSLGPKVKFIPDLAAKALAASETDPTGLLTYLFANAADTDWFDVAITFRKAALVPSPGGQPQINMQVQSVYRSPQDIAQ